MNTQRLLLGGSKWLLLRAQQQQQQQRLRRLLPTVAVGGGVAPSRRLLSSGSRKSQLQQEQHSQQQQHNEQRMPTWPAMASMLVVPVMFAAWGASEWMFGNQQTLKNEQLRQAFEKQQKQQQQQQQQQQYVDINIDSGDNQEEILLYGVVRRTSGFTHCMSGIKVGDVVEVLQEGVGPDEQYNLCRLPAKQPAQSKPKSNNDPSLAMDTVGWFPTRWLQRLDDYDRMVQEQQQQNNIEK